MWQTLNLFGRSARAAESDSLLMSWPGKLGPRVQIPPSPPDAEYLGGKSRQG
jgi:hypothetical protein